MNFLNCTPHAIVLNDGTVFQPLGTVTRVSAGFSAFDDNLICNQTFGNVTDLSDPQSDTFYIVSALVLSAVKWQYPDRNDFVAPATGHPDCIRNDKGQIVSVPGFVR